MIANPINKKKYCISKCAKDKFQTWIIEPVLAVLFFLVAIPVVFLVFSIIGLISMALQFLLFGDVIFLEPNIAAQGIAALVFGGITYFLFYKSNKAINTWVSTQYQTKYKKSCTLFEECK